MKIRSGFVSNSSSSSFLIFGLYNEKEITLTLKQGLELIKIRLGDDAISQDQLDDLRDCGWLDTDEWNNWDLDDDLVALFGQTGYRFYNDHKLLGLSLSIDNGEVAEFENETYQKTLEMAKSDLIQIGFSSDDISSFWYGVTPGGDW